MFQCPQCKGAEQDGASALEIYAHPSVTIEVDTDESVIDYTVGDLEYDDDDVAYCRACGWEGTVKDISVEEYEEDTA